MSLLVAVKIKGDGLTTAVQALSLVWPRRDRRRVVAELNPDGGDLGLRYGLLDPPNLVTLASGTQPLTGCLQQVGEVSMLLAPPSPVQTQAALEGRWVPLARELAALADTDVLVDAGRLVNPPQGNVEVLARADLGVIVVRPTLDAVTHLLTAQASIPVPHGGLVMLIVGEGPIKPREIEEQSGLAVVGDLPWDREGAKMLMSGSWSQRALRHTRLLRWSVNVAEALAELLDQATGSRGPVASAPAAVPTARPHIETAVR